MSRAAFAAVGLAIMAAVRPIAQAPARDVAEGHAAGTGVISGVVVSDAVEQPQSLARAIVTIRGTELRRSRSAITDDEGRFTFTDLPAGRFTLTAARAGYVPSEYGARRPGRPGAPIALGKGEHASNVVIKVPRGAVLTGVVSSSDGQPAQDVRVTVFGADAASLFDAGGGRGGPTRAAGTAVTDDRGIYHVYGLRPGEYIIVATPRVAGVGEMAVVAEAEIDAILRDLAGRRAGAASAPGQAQQTGAQARTKGQPRTVAYAPVYFPGTALVSEAAKVALAAGEERTGIDLQLVPVPTATMTGTVVGPDGQPVAGAMLSLNAGGPSMPASLGLAGGSLGVTTANDGTFSYHTVPPGVLRVIARKENLWGMTELTISGDDVAGVTIAMQPLLKMAGRLAFDSQSTASIDPARIRIVMKPLGAKGASLLARAVRADGTFEIPGIVPGSYQISCEVPPEAGRTWIARSATAGGRDALDSIEMLPGRDVSDALITLTDRHTVITGHVPGNREPGAQSVVFFPADSALWRFPSRRVRAAPIAADGSYVVYDLPPGEYSTGVVADLDENELDAPHLQSLTRNAVTLTLADGERKTVDLRAGGTGR